MTTQMNVTYINALLADASYVVLSNANGILPDDEIKENLSERLTQPLADFISSNFTVVNQQLSSYGTNRGQTPIKRASLTY